MKKTKCVTKKTNHGLTREDAHLHINCNLESGECDVELIGSSLVQHLYEDVIMEELLRLLVLLINAQDLELVNLESEDK